MGSTLGKYKSIVISVALFLLLDASVLILNFYISFKIADDAQAVNIAGRQRMLSQRMTKSLFDIRENNAEQSSHNQATIDELKKSSQLFNTTLQAFSNGGNTQGAQGSRITLEKVNSKRGEETLAKAKLIWQPYIIAINNLLNAQGEPTFQQRLDEAIQIGRESNIELLGLMNTLTVELENIAKQQASTLRYIQAGGISLAIMNFLIILFHFIGQLKSNDRTLEEARQETQDILSTVNEGLFLLNDSLVIGSQHSTKLADMFGSDAFEGKHFSSILSRLVKPSDLETAQRFIGLLFKETINSNLINDLNPLNQVETHLRDQEGSQVTRYLKFDFKRVERFGKFTDVLVTVNDITEAVKLSRALEEEKKRNAQQLEVLQGILHADPHLLKRFIEDTLDTCIAINQILQQPSKNSTAMLTKLKEIFIEIHNIKGESSALSLDAFTNLAHQFENDIVELQEKSNLGGNDFLKLTIHLDKLMNYAESVKQLADKLATLSNLSTTKRLDSNFETTLVEPQRKPPQEIPHYWAPLEKLCQSVARRESKQVILKTHGLDQWELAENHKSLIKDICIQTIRNAIVHSIELPDSRLAQHKPINGHITVRLEKNIDKQLELSIEDDGEGFNFNRIRERARKLNKWPDAEISRWDQKKLISLIFTSGFSTAPTVSEDAGRGVGMALIRRRVDFFGGKIKVTAARGKGTRFIITLPDTKKNILAA